MKWAQAYKVYATLFERDEIRNHLNDVGGIDDFVYGCPINHYESEDTNYFLINARQWRFHNKKNRTSLSESPAQKLNEAN